MNKAIMKLAAGAAALALLGPGTAAARSLTTAPAFNHCGLVQMADGNTSLEDVAANGNYPLNGIIRVQLECGPGGDWTPWMAAYLNQGDQSLDMQAGTRYWPGSGNINN